MSNQSNNATQIGSIALVQALYDFTAEESSEMSMRKGEQMDVLDMDPKLNGWAYCRRRKDQKEGYVPVSYLGSRHKGYALMIDRTPHSRGEVIIQ